MRFSGPLHRFKHKYSLNSIMWYYVVTIPVKKKKGHLCDLLLAIMKLQRQQVWHLWLWHLLVVIHLVPKPPATVTALAESDHRRPGLVNPFRSRGASLQIQPQYGPGLDTGSICFMLLLGEFFRLSSVYKQHHRLSPGFLKDFFSSLGPLRGPCFGRCFRNFRDT